MLRGIEYKLMDFGLTYSKDIMGRKHAVGNTLTQRPELTDWHKMLGIIEYGERVRYPDQSRTSHDDVQFSVFCSNL